MQDTYNEKSLNKIYLKLRGLEDALNSILHDEPDIESVCVILLEVIKTLQTIVRILHVET